ncbi:hypothetical protein [Spirosoma foliorum]|uniref:Uncharacterized protein n=1 Tax=Spirosoma foliorum TaxID=2710596 RepID=A0A7G5H217_9BACT|nr:hypothetical protein [Spirosoma foliorum]QMW05159.1 hypothetical protein H3H32_09840 [Spirosoma foliorum]
MESIHLHTLASHAAKATPSRTIRRKVNGAATAALLIKMATEILTASPTLRKSANLTLMDLAAADKVRKSLQKRVE